MILHDPEILRKVLKRHGLTAEKGLGQHFLVSESAVSAILASVSECKGILEIGPGPGVLTHPLSEANHPLTAVELDPRFVAILKETAPQAKVKFEDALQADLAILLEELPSPRAIVSNLPYYITAPLINKIVDQRNRIDCAVLMMQKEVALRIIAPPGDGERGSLSVFLQAHFEIRRVANVPASAFLPPPKVDSLVLKFVPRPPGFPPGTEDVIFKLVRQGFAQPRKTLANNLMAGLRLDRGGILDLLEGLGHNEKVRAQALTQAEWVALHDAVAAIKIT